MNDFLEMLMTALARMPPPEGPGLYTAVWPTMAERLRAPEQAQERPLLQRLIDERLATRGGDPAKRIIVPQTTPAMPNVYYGGMMK